MRRIEVTSRYSRFLIYLRVNSSQFKIKAMEHVARYNAAYRRIEELTDIKNRFVSRGKTVERHFLPTMSSSRSLPRRRSPRPVSTTVSRAFLSLSLSSLSATEPKLVLSGSMRAREYTTRGSTARSSIYRFAFRFAEKPLAGSREHDRHLRVLSHTSVFSSK